MGIHCDLGAINSSQVGDEPVGLVRDEYQSTDQCPKGKIRFHVQNLPFSLPAFPKKLPLL